MRRGLINDTLDFSKIEAGKLELAEIDFDLVALVADTAEMLAPLAEEKFLEFAYYVHPDVPSRLCGDDPDRLRQVLINLTSNAIKFTERGEVVITASLADATDTDVTVRLEVRDTGIGIPADRMDRLFRSFSQVDPSTATLRRHRSRPRHLQAIGRHDGRRDFRRKYTREVPTSAPAVRSPPDRFPRAHHPHAHKRFRKPPRVGGRRQRRLARDPLQCAAAPGRSSRSPSTMPQQRLAAMCRAAESKPFQLILADKQMPDMTGQQLAQAARHSRHPRRARRAAHLAQRHALDRAAPRTLHLCGVAHKPVRPSQLFDVMVAALAGDFAHDAPTERMPESLEYRPSKPVPCESFWPKTTTSTRLSPPKRSGSTAITAKSSPTASPPSKPSSVRGSISS